MLEPYRGQLPTIGAGAFIHHSATLIGRVKIGEGSSVWPHVSLRGDVGPIEIGAFTSVQDNTVGHTTNGVSELYVGSRVTVGHSTILHGCRIADDCIIGMGAIVMDNAVISDWTIVGAGALVPPDKIFPPGVLLLGRPAKVARILTAEDRDWITQSWKIYAGLAKDYNAG
ncbi:MAG: gamma carbonic anhydrase family protein [Myxococcota bacterium]